MNYRQSANFPILSLITALLLIAGLGTGMLCTFFPARSPDHPKPDIPLLLQFDERWKNEPYGTSDLQSAGCAPTCIAMIFSYLNKDPEIDPVAIARFSESNGHYVDGAEQHTSCLLTQQQPITSRNRTLHLMKTRSIRPCTKTS